MLQSWRLPFILLVLLLLYAALLGPVRMQMSQRPFAEKLGLIPHPQALKALAPDFQELLGAAILGRVTLYFGSLVGNLDDPRLLSREVDYPAMSRAMHAAVQLDPYNMDAYYFGQAVLVWDVGQYQLANELLDYGMKYRDWDWQLPFFAGFNQAFFLHDLEKAGEMFMRAGELSGSAMFKTLAGRYLQQAGRTQTAIVYLKSQLKGASHPAVRRSLQTRVQAFEEVRRVEVARDRHLLLFALPPLTIDDLLAGGLLTNRPIDPYGGSFFLSADGEVLTTSRFSYVLGSGRQFPERLLGGVSP